VQLLLSAFEPLLDQPAHRFTPDFPQAAVVEQRVSAPRPHRACESRFAGV